jgi:hypothetical protein
LQAQDSPSPPKNENSLMESEKKRGNFRKEVISSNLTERINSIRKNFNLIDKKTIIQNIAKKKQLEKENDKNDQNISSKIIKNFISKYLYKNFNLNFIYNFR